MSRSTHDYLSYLYSEKRRWHSAGGQWYPESRWERKPMQISRSKTVTLCCWLWEVIGKMLQWCTVQLGERPRKGSLYFFLFSFSFCACARGEEGTCVYFQVCFVCVCFSPGNYRAEQTRSCLTALKPTQCELWGCEDSWWRRVGGTETEMESRGKKDVVAATNYSWF